jgi:hypothetical protein
LIKPCLEIHVQALGGPFSDQKKPCLKIHSNVGTQPEHIEIANTLSNKIALQCICMHRSYRLPCPTDLHYNTYQLHTSVDYMSVNSLHFAAQCSLIAAFFLIQLFYFHTYQLHTSVDYMSINSLHFAAQCSSMQSNSSLFFDTTLLLPCLELHAQVLGGPF